MKKRKITPKIDEPVQEVTQEIDTVVKTEPVVEAKPDNFDVKYNTYEWIKKDLGTVVDGYKLVGLEMSGEAGLIIEHWSIL